MFSRSVTVALRPIALPLQALDIRRTRAGFINGAERPGGASVTGVGNGGFPLSVLGPSVAPVRATSVLGSVAGGSQEQALGHERKQGP